MVKSTPEFRRFVSASMLLLAAIIVSGLVLLPEVDAPVTAADDDFLDRLADDRRVALRYSPLMTRIRNNGVDPYAGDYEYGVTKSKAKQGGTGIVKNDRKLNPDAIEPPPLMDDTGLDPDIQAAIEAIDRGNVQDAVGLLEQVLKRDPRNEQALVELAMINLLDLKRPGEAIGYLQRVMDVNPQNRIVMSELVSLYEEEGRIEEGLDFMMDMAARSPEASELAHGIGQMLSMQGRDAEAIPHLEKAAVQADDKIRAHRDLAEAYSRNGDPAKAVEAYNNSISAQLENLQDKRDRGMPTTFAEERLNYTRLDLVREMVNSGDLENAQRILQDVESAMPGDEQVTALRDQIERKRAG